ncbi:hypothetical protein ACFL1H_02440 [Nanoarchaeota archaeon]
MIRPIERRKRENKTKNNNLKNIFSIIMLITFFLLVLNIVTAAKPTLYHIEEISNLYSQDGSLIDSTQIGYFEVDVNSQNDVLQYVLVNLSTTAGTNLLDTIAYRNTASSPVPGSRTRLFVKTTNSDQDLTYEVPGFISPDIYINVTRRNIDGGGRDLYQFFQNNMTFNITLKANTFLPNSIMRLQLRKDTFNMSSNSTSNPGNLSYVLTDAMNITNVTCDTHTSFEILDTDSDGWNDLLIWQGDILTTPTLIQFDAHITPDIEYEEDDRIQYLNPPGSQAIRISYIMNGLLSMVKVIDKFSRGPIREGVDLIYSPDHFVKGFIKNIAVDLEYIMHSYKMFKIDNPTPVLDETFEVSLLPGEQFDTKLHKGSESKGATYYSSSFEWEALWNEVVNESSIITFNKYLDNLKEIYVYPLKSYIIRSNSPGNRKATIIDTAKHIGYPDLEVKFVELNSSIDAPWLFVNDSLKAFYIPANGTPVDITSSVLLDYKQPASPGFVYVAFTPLPVLGHYVHVNDEIEIQYDVVSASATNFLQLNEFDIVGYMTTFSGTRTFDDYEIGIPKKPPPPPGEDEADLFKIYDSLILDGNVGDVTVDWLVYDTGTKGISDIHLYVYLPIGSEMINDNDDFYVEIYDDSSRTWTTQEINVQELGIEKVNDVDYIAFKISNKYGSWHQYNDDVIRINYKAKLAYGTHLIVSRARGNDPYEPILIFADSYLPYILREIKEIPFSFNVSFEQCSAWVDLPVKWIMFVDVHNPYNHSIEETLKLEVFPDTMHVFFDKDRSFCCEAKPELDIKSYGTYSYIEFTDIFQPGTNSYTLDVITPPVIETNRVTNVEESCDYVYFIINSSLESLALEDYNNEKMIMPLEYEKVIKVVDEEGIPVPYYKFDDYSILITVPYYPNMKKKNVIIYYMEYPPLVFTDINKYNFNCEDTLQSTIFIAANEKTVGLHLETEISGPNNLKETVYANYWSIGYMYPNEVLNRTFTLDIKNLPEGKYTLVSKLRRGFLTLVEDETTFVIRCDTFINRWWILLIFILLLLLTYLCIRYKYCRKIWYFIMYLFYRIKEWFNRFKKEDKPRKKKRKRYIQFYQFEKWADNRRLYVLRKKKGKQKGRMRDTLLIKKGQTRKSPKKPSFLNFEKWKNNDRNYVSRKEKGRNKGGFKQIENIRKGWNRKSPKKPSFLNFEKWKNNDRNYVSRKVKGKNKGGFKQVENIRKGWNKKPKKKVKYYEHEEWLDYRDSYVDRGQKGKNKGKLKDIKHIRTRKHNVKEKPKKHGFFSIERWKDKGLTLTKRKKTGQLKDWRKVKQKKKKSKKKK